MGQSPTSLRERQLKFIRSVKLSDEVSVRAFVRQGIDVNFVGDGNAPLPNVLEIALGLETESVANLLIRSGATAPNLHVWTFEALRNGRWQNTATLLLRSCIDVSFMLILIA
jgi:hypothetical protein